MKAVTRAGKTTAPASIARSSATRKSSAKRKPGRPKLQVDMNQVERLCRLGATHAEIAEWLRISKRTLEYWLLDEKTLYEVVDPKSGEVLSLTLRSLMERGYAGMRLSIRRQQMLLLKKGNATMGVWLGKQYLGQSDRLRIVEPPPTTEADASLEVPVTLEELLRAYRKAAK